MRLVSSLWSFRFVVLSSIFSCKNVAGLSLRCVRPPSRKKGNKPEGIMLGARTWRRTSYAVFFSFFSFTFYRKEAFLWNMQRKLSALPWKVTPCCMPLGPNPMFHFTMWDLTNPWILSAPTIQGLAFVLWVFETSYWPLELVEAPFLSLTWELAAICCTVITMKGSVIDQEKGGW